MSSTATAEEYTEPKTLDTTVLLESVRDVFKSTNRTIKQHYDRLSEKRTEQLVQEITEKLETLTANYTLSTEEQEAYSKLCNSLMTYVTSKDKEGAKKTEFKEKVRLVASWPGVTAFMLAMYIGAMSVAMQPADLKEPMSKTVFDAYLGCLGTTAVSIGVGTSAGKIYDALCKTGLLKPDEGTSLDVLLQYKQTMKTFEYEQEQRFLAIKSPPTYGLGGI